jgi:hypothetical protein
MNASVVDSIASRLRGEVGGLHIFRTTLPKCSFFDDLLTWTVNRSLISTTSLRLCFPQFPAAPPYRAINFRSHPSRTGWRKSNGGGGSRKWLVLGGARAATHHNKTCQRGNGSLIEFRRRCAALASSRTNLRQV